MAVVEDVVAPTREALPIDIAPSDENVEAVRLPPDRVVEPPTETPPVTVKVPPETVKFSLDVTLLTEVVPVLKVMVTSGPAAPTSGMRTSSPAAGTRLRSQLAATPHDPPAGLTQVMAAGARRSSSTSS